MISRREWEILDRFTRMDERLELIAKTLDEIKDLLAGVRVPPKIEIPRVEVPRIEIPKIGKVEVEKLDEIIEILRSYVRFIEFTYPPDAVRAKLVGIGTTVVDFYEGVVRLPDGTYDNLNDRLKAHGLTYVQSLAIEVDRNAKYKIDDRGFKPICAYDPQYEEHQRFSRLTLVTTETTAVTIWASTNPSGASRKVGASVLDLKGVKETPKSITVDNTKRYLLVDDSPRVAVLISNLGANTVYLVDKETTDYSVGIPLAEGKIMVDTITRDYWYGQTASGSTDVRVLKIVRGGIWAR